MAFFSSIRNRPVLGFLLNQHYPTCQKWSPEEQLRYLFGFESRHSVVCDLPRQTCATLDHTQDWQDKMYTKQHRRKQEFHTNVNSTLVGEIKSVGNK